MNDTVTLPAQIASARATAKPIEDRISAVLKEPKSEDQATALRQATNDLGLLSIETFRFFERSLEGHFRRGPFCVRLRDLLVSEGHVELGDRLREYYLAVNVLKHGRGKSHRFLLEDARFVLPVQADVDFDGSIEGASLGLIDVSGDTFFRDLTKTMLEAHDFLLGRSV